MILALFGRLRWNISVPVDVWLMRPMPWLMIG